MRLIHRANSCRISKFNQGKIMSDRYYSLPSNVRREKDPEQRYTYLRANWEELRTEAMARESRGGVRAENSFSSALTTQFLIDGAVTKLQNRFAALKCFTRDFSTDSYKPRATGEIKFADATDNNVQTNATNFETGDSTVDPCTVTVNEYSRSFHVTNDQLNSGLRLDDLLDINMATFANSVIQTVTSVMTASNFPTPAIVRPPGNFGWGDMQTAFGLLKKSPIRNAVLDGEYLANIINVPTQFQKSGASPSERGAWAAFGWDNIALNTNWTAADANVRGFICGPQAIGVLAGLPLISPFAESHGLERETVKIPGLELSIAFHRWFQLSGRQLWASFDLMLGASVLDSTAGLLIKSA
jgi:hypothetical protein